MALYGYARVSTEDQTNDPQLHRLNAEGVTEITTDVISGSVPSYERPGLSALLKRLRAGDSLVTVKLDRLGRDTIDVMALVRELDAKGVRLRILNIGVETGTPNGRLFLTILAGFAEFEREIIRERTRAGLVAARAAGKILGRPQKLTSYQRHYVCKLVAQGVSLREVGRILGVSKTTVWRIVHHEEEYSS
ncbi:recombinase family protein [Acetobacter fabarum]|uniref:recombinase family protein n=1 Tax=Acetobacter fabarum TaxID=483199 RepID=UPI0020A01CB2|nr:recombinase family protein [Acetobacter fabarum]MCP1227767.1 recombinase family protein [Acetobacter fabarum]MCP1234736.1 recombinase family protein [Acetobacter fabarum]